MMISSRTTKVVIIIIFLVAAVSLLHKTWHFCEVYPFSRITIKSTLTHSVRLFNTEDLFGYRIVSINGKSVTGEDALSRFMGIDQEFSVVIEKDGIRKSFFVVNTHFNTDFFVFCFFLLVIGSVHFIWGLMVYFIKQIYASARYYSRFSINLGLLYMAVVHYCITADNNVITIIAVSLFYQILRMLLEMSHIPGRNRISHFLLSFFLVITPVVLISPVTIPFRISISVYLTALLSTAVLFSLYVLKRNLGNRYRNRTTYIILSAGLIGILMPVFLVGVMIHSDFPVPFSLVSFLTIIMPVIIGRNFIEQSQINDIITRKIYSLQFSVDFIAGAAIALSLSVPFFVPWLGERYGIGVIFTASFIVLLLRYVLLFRVRIRMSGGRDWYTESLQRITENTVTTDSIVNRLERIKSEVSTHLQVQFIRIGIFEERIRALPGIASPDIIYLPPASPIARYYEKTDDIIKRDLLLNRTLDDSLAALDDADSIYLVVPVSLHGRVSGILFLGKKRGTVPFFKDDINYLSTTGTLIFQMVENEVLFDQSLIRGTFEKELDNASYVQMRLFPAQIPADRGLETSIYYRPFNKVTGDLIDIIPIDEARTALFIGDITGHGLPAAMVHSTTVALIHSLLREGYDDIQDILDTLNSFLINRYRGHELLTLFGCIYNKETHLLEYVNAGHPMPYIISRQEDAIKPIESRGHILGVMESPFYDKSSLYLQRGEQLLFYTDGIVEIQRSQSESNIGETFLEETLREMLDTTIEEKTEQLLHYIDETDQANISDDITFALIEIE